MQTDQALTFTNHIRRHASKYYPGFTDEHTHVQLLEKQERAAAMLYRFKVSSNAKTRSVFVKAPLHSAPDSNPANQNVLTKPMLYPKTDTKDRHWLQYTALVAIYEYFTKMNETQFGAIRALDYLPEHHAVFTEDSNDPNLRQLMLNESRWHLLWRNGRLASVFGNVGSWLHLYHRMPKKEDVSIRHENRQDYIDAITTLTDFLGKTLGEESYLSKIASSLIQGAVVELPESLPLGLGHGDYAMRNILVGPNHRVTVLDTFAKWQTPIYEDIGYFINELRMSSPQVISQGVAFSSNQLFLYEDAFLKGYFGGSPIPHAAVKLYEALALLDRWSSLVAKSDRQIGFAKVSGPLKMNLTNRYIRKRMRNLLAEISSSR